MNVYFQYKLHLKKNKSSKPPTHPLSPPKYNPQKKQPEEKHHLMFLCLLGQVF